MAETLPQQERPATPEKSPEGLYLEALEKKRDTLLAFHAMNDFRKGKSPEDMTSEEVEQYKILRDDWQNKKESSLSSWDSLPEDKQEELAAMGSRLLSVQVKLTLLKHKEASESGTAETATPGASGQEAPVSAPATETREPAVVEQPESGVGLEEAQKMLKYSKDTGRILESAYWESKVSELQQRQEAEASPDRTAPKGFLARVKDSFDRARGVGPIEQSRMNPSGLNERPLARTAPEGAPAKPEAAPAPQETQAQPEVTPKKPSAWGWLKERGKGVWNFGIWEFHQAERFRSKTKEAAQEAKALATLIQEERDMSPETAEKEAWEIVSELKSKGLDISAPEFYQVSSELSEKKRKENDDEIDYIIKSTSNGLLDKLQKYRGEAGQDVLTEENKLAFQTDLRTQLDKLRDGFLKQYTVDLAKVMRRNLDEKWKWRYVWGGLEALAGFMGVGFLTMKYSAVEAAKAVATSPEAAKEFITQTMDQNVWHTLKEMAQNGPQHFTPTDQQLVEWGKAVTETNHWYEPEWVKSIIEGFRSTRTLPQGIPMNVPSWIARAMGFPV